MKPSVQNSKINIWTLTKYLRVPSYMKIIVVLVALCFAYVVADKVDSVLQRICDKAELKESWKLLQSWQDDDPRRLFMLSGLEVLLFSNIEKAIDLHKQAKALSSTTMPPLADLHLKGKLCGGLADLYYVAAVITKQMVDLHDQISPLGKKVSSTEDWLEHLETLVTLTADSGLHDAAEAHLQSALRLLDSFLQISPNSAQYQSKLLSFMFRGALLTPGVYSSQEHVNGTRQLMSARLQGVADLVDNQHVRLQNLDEFSLSTTFFLVYQGFNDRQFLSRLHELYGLAFPALAESLLPSATAPPVSPTSSSSARSLKVGFVSSYFRRHSICKLYCDVVKGLARRGGLEVFVFSTLSAAQGGDEETQSLQSYQEQHSNFHFVHIDRMLLSNRAEVSGRGIDVLVYLDIGMDPGSIIWASGRLAPVQLLTWGHPSTGGMAGGGDFFVSSALFHAYPSSVSPSPLPYDAQASFSEQLVQLSSLGLAFPDRRLLPSHLYTRRAEDEDEPVVARGAEFLDLMERHIALSKDGKAKNALAGMLRMLRSDRVLLLLPQYTPKLHPIMDEAVLSLLAHHEDFFLVLLDNEKKGAWRATLLRRWRSVLQSARFAMSPAQTKKFLEEKLLWLPSLSPAEYLSVLALGHVMLDPFPFGGGVTVLESLEVCTPVVTLPSQQNVPQLATGILARLFGVKNVLREEHHVLHRMIASSAEEYVDRVVDLVRAQGDEALRLVRRHICKRKHVLFGEKSEVSKESVEDWHRLLMKLGKQVKRVV